MRSLFVALSGTLLLFASLQADQKKAKICLTMVVENDASVIEPCLSSIKDIIDCFSICIIDSTDNTLEIIQQFAQKNKIPGRFYFLASQTAELSLIEAAQTTLEELGFSLEHTYLLTLEPDMTVHKESGFEKDTLEADAYLLLEKSSSLSYYAYVPRLLRSALSWENRDVMHPDWSCNKSHETLKLHTLMLDRHADEKRSAHRLESTINQLTEALQNNPDDAHTLFILAQSHRGLKNYQEALHFYHARSEKGGNQEEVWFSKYMMGECHEEMGEWNEALYWYLEAYQHYPERTASLRKIATYYRMRGQNDLACIFAKYGSLIPYPKDQNLFSFLPGQTHHFDEELSIAAYYTRFREEGFDAAANLLLKKNVPWEVREQTYQNLLFYVQNLKNASFTPITLELPPIFEGSDQHYNPMNPSILKTEKGYQLICRTVNYTQIGAKIFNTIDPTGIFRTKNFLIQYDQNFNLLSQQLIVENLPRRRVHSWISANIVGMDDCRVFTHEQYSYFTCTTSDTNPTGNFQISLCRLSNEREGKTVRVDKLTPLKGPDPNRCEKNWLPFIKDGSLHLIYSYDPFIIYKPNMETGECEIALSYRPSYDFSRFRGSAAPIAFDEGYLMLIHEVVQLPNYERRYLHRFLYLDKNFSVQRLSKPFTFLHLGIEYCCNMTLDHTGSTLILPIGIEDREAYLCFIDLDTVRSLLNPLPTNVEHS